MRVLAPRSTLYIAASSALLWSMVKHVFAVTAYHRLTAGLSETKAETLQRSLRLPRAYRSATIPAIQHWPRLAPHPRVGGVVGALLKPSSWRRKMSRTKRVVLLALSALVIATPAQANDLATCMMYAGDQLAYCLELGLYPPSMCENTYDIVDRMCHQQYAT